MWEDVENAYYRSRMTKVQHEQEKAHDKNGWHDDSIKINQEWMSKDNSR